MAREKSPAFQFYPADFLADSNVMLMTMPERGAYITLLSVAWIEGAIPVADPAALRRLLGGHKPSARVLSCFRKDGTHKRLEEERGKQETWREKSRAGAAKRWGGNAGRVATVMPTSHSQTVSSGYALQSSSSSSIPPLPPQGGRDGVAPEDGAPPEPAREPSPKDREALVQLNLGRGADDGPATVLQPMPGRRLTRTEIEQRRQRLKAEAAKP